MDSRRRNRRVSFTLPRRKSHNSVIGGINCIIKLDGDASRQTATGGRDGVVRVWGENMSEQTVLEGHVDWVNDVTAVGENVIASCSSDSQVKLWDINETRCTATFSPHSDYVKQCVFSKPLGLLFSASFDGTIAAIDVVKAQTTCKGAYHFAEALQSIYAMGTQGDLVAIGTTDNTVKVIDWRTGRVHMQLKGHKDIVRDITWAYHDTNILATCASDGTMRYWDVRNEKCALVVHTGQGSLWCLEEIPGKGRVGGAEMAMLSGGRNGTLLSTFTDYKGASASLVAAPSTPITSLALTGNTLWLSSSSASHPLSTWDLTDFLSSPAVTSYAPPPPQRSRSLTPPQPPHPLSECSLNIHHLVPSHLDRHAFSLPPHLLRSIPPGAKKGFDSPEAVEGYVSSMGCALVGPDKECESEPPLVAAKVLGNKRHCLTRDAEGSVGLWDLVSGEMCEAMEGHDDLEKLAEEIEEKYIKTAVASWCYADVTTGMLTVHLDHPSAFLCESTLWERDLSNPFFIPPPKPLSHASLMQLKAERPPINYGESALLGLFKSLLKAHNHRFVEDCGKLPSDSMSRAAYLEREASHARNKGLPTTSLLRVMFSYQPSTLITVWSRREAPPKTPSKNEPPEVGCKVVYSHDGEPYHPHTRCQVSEVQQYFSKGAEQKMMFSWRLPVWVAEMLESRELSLTTRSANIFFSLESVDKTGIADLPTGCRRLSGSPKLRMFKVAEEIVKILKLKLPSFAAWEAPCNTPTSPGSGAGDAGESVAPEEYIQLIANNTVVDPLWSLSTVDKYYRSKNKELVIYYERNRP